MRHVWLLLLACLGFLSACGGGDGDNGDATPTVETETATAQPAEEETTEETEAPDPAVGGAGVACRTKEITIEFAPDGGATLSAGGAVLTTSARLRTAPLYGFAEGCTRTGPKDGTVAEPFEVVEEEVTLSCSATNNIEIAGRAAVFDGKSGYELSAAAEGSSSFFVKTHYEVRGGSAYLLYAPASCDRE